MATLTLYYIMCKIAHLMLPWQWFTLLCNM